MIAEGPHSLALVKHPAERVTLSSTRLELPQSNNPQTMPPKQVGHRQPYDLIPTRYSNPINNSKFDENGNVFLETIVRASQLPDWTLTKPRQFGIAVKEGGSAIRHKGDGPPLLWDIIRRLLNNNLKELSVEALEAVPWEVMKHIWQDVLLT